MIPFGNPLAHSCLAPSQDQPTSTLKVHLTRQKGTFQPLIQHLHTCSSCDQVANCHATKMPCLNEVYKDGGQWITDLLALRFRLSVYSGIVRLY